MQPIPKEQAQTILEPLVDKIRKAIKTAVNGYYQGTDYSETRYRHSARTAASICHDDIVEEIQNEFENVPGARFGKKRGLFTLCVYDTVLLRFKKFNKNLLSNSITTRQALAFNLQEPAQLELDEMPPDGLLHVGYTVNKLATEVTGVFVTYRYGNQNIWTWDITHEANVAQQIAFPSHTQEATPRRKIRAKTTSVGENSAAGS